MQKGLHALTFFPSIICNDSVSLLSRGDQLLDRFTRFHKAIASKSVPWLKASFKSINTSPTIKISCGSFGVGCALWMSDLLSNDCSVDDNVGVPAVKEMVLRILPVR